MTDFLRALSSTAVASNWGLVQRHDFELRRRDGTWQRQMRETYDSGDGAAVLLCDVAAGIVVLTRQFRFPAFYRGEAPFLVEACAGKLDGDTPEACVRREALEETGYAVGHIERAFDCFVSPGAVTERVTLLVGHIEGPPRTGGGGLAAEGEDIEVLHLPFRTALAMVETGEIADAKTILLLHYAALKGVFG